MIYGDKLKELREGKELTIHDISNMLGLERDTYGKYEREYILIPIKHLNNVSNYFNVSLDYIFNFTCDSNYPDIKQDVNLNIIGLRLKELRKDNKLTQEKLSKILNVARSVIAGYETGKNLVATPFLYQICKKYNISADYLLGKIDKPKYLK